MIFPASPAGRPLDAIGNRPRIFSAIRSRRKWTAAALGAAVLVFPGLRAELPATRTGFATTYPQTYKDWANAFLAGDGKMGIMVFGNPLNETTIFNDRGFNIASRGERSFAQVSKADTDKIRSLCAAGKFEEANKLAVDTAHYRGGSEGNRHPGYAMFIDIPEDGEVRDYSRVVDFRTGVITVKWTDNRGAWERRSFVSRKDNVTVQYLTAPTKGKLNCTIRLAIDPDMRLPRELKSTSTATNDFMNLRAKYFPDRDAGYEGATRVVVTGGTHSASGDTITVSNADSVLLLSRTRKYYDKTEEQWNRQDLQKQLSAIPASYAQLLAGQVATHGTIYDRVAIDLGASAADRAKPNEELLAEQRKSPAPVPALWERIFDAGRYHYLSSSSDQTPPDLLGIWTGDTNAGWGGFYHLDVNANLQSSSGNIGNMPEAMEGYFKINEDWADGFRTTAKKLLNVRGFVAAGNTPGPTTGLIAGISDFYPYQYATGEEGWMLYPFWEHYLVTGDKEFLRKRLYPLLKEMGNFYEDFLTKKDAKGNYIFAASVSPENQPSNRKVSLVNNSVFDISGGKFCLTALIQTCNILGIDQGPGGVEKWKALLAKFPPYLVNEEGALKEWAWPGLNEEYGHRHWSHCLTVFPYQEITREGTPELFNAASVTLAKKDAHKIEPGHGVLNGALIASKLGNAESVRNKILQLTREDYYYDSLATSHDPRHNTFCTDTAHAMPTIMMEMLITSRPGVLELLPALPPGIDKGEITGVKGRNRVTIEALSWDVGARTVKCTLKSDIDQSLTLIERSGIKAIQTSAKVAPSPLGEAARVVQLKAGESTPISILWGDLRPRFVNLAWKKPVTVSSTSDGYPAEGAVDEDSGTRWASESKDNQWIQVDLGSRQKISGIKLYWEAAAAKDYDVEISDDAKSWKVIKAVKGNTAAGLVEFPNLNLEGRYVRVNGKTRLSAYGFSLWEIQVLGKQ